MDVQVTPVINTYDTQRFPPLDRNSFALEFAQAGSTILNHEIYAQHARKILAEERNFLGLFALDTVLKNKEGQYRRDDITVKANHPILLFFQAHAFHEADKEVLLNTPQSTDIFLSDRPDLDKILTLLHDEGEDADGFTKKALIKKMHKFVDEINEYVEKHNEMHPNAKVDFPTEPEIKRMRTDIAVIAKSFDALTKNYRGQASKRSYYQYHVDMLEDERACRIKVIDKACNAATFSYRNREMLIRPNDEILIARYKEWHTAQMNKVRDLYFNQDFSKVIHGKTYEDDMNEDENECNGFINAASIKYPNSKKLLQTMKKVIRIQLNIYENDISNLNGKHGSPALRTRYPNYDRLIFSPRINLIKITQSRLNELIRLDKLGDKVNKNRGMFGIPFDSAIACRLPVLNTGAGKHKFRPTY